LRQIFWDKKGIFDKLKKKNGIFDKLKKMEFLTN